MPFTVLVGCQWGDEGKGKIVDLLAEDADWVARFQGGANAGHTVFVGERRAVLHLVPTGILRPGVRCAIGNGVVLDPVALLDEVCLLDEMGIAWRDRLRISPLAHLVTPIHKTTEILRQQDRLIGTTRRGIGPTYEAKAARIGLRAEDLLDERRLRERLRAQWELLRSALDCQPEGTLDRLAGEAGGGGHVSGMFDPTRQGLDELIDLFADARRIMVPLVCDVTDLLLSEDDAGRSILCEGAQGALLDIDHGTYPFVTSSNTTVGGACTGLGIPPQRIKKVIGVVKAYATRVGEGPFPTEFHGEVAEQFREKAGEYGATTGRPRRCGWFDAVLAKRTARINGVDELIVTKMDVLSGCQQLRLAVAYRASGAQSVATAGAFWPSAAVLEGVTPEYVDVPGWQMDLSGAPDWSALPGEARAYVDRIGHEIGVPVRLVSIGPGREEVVRREA